MKYLTDWRSIGYFSIIYNVGIHPLPEFRLLLSRPTVWKTVFRATNLEKNRRKNDWPTNEDIEATVCECRFLTDSGTFGMRM